MESLLAGGYNSWLGQVLVTSLCQCKDSMNVRIFALVHYKPVIGGVGGDVIELLKLAVFVVVVVQWWWWWSSGGCDSCCKGGNSDTCRIAILKCVLGRGVGGDRGAAGLVVVLW